MHCCHLSVVASRQRLPHMVGGAFLTFVLFAAKLAQQHAAQLLPPVNVFGIVFLYQPVKVALSLVIRVLVELLFRGPVAQRPVSLGDNPLPVGSGGEDGPELRHGSLRHDIHLNAPAARPVWVEERAVVAQWW